MSTTPLQNHFLIVLIAAALVVSFYILQPFLSPLVLGVVFAVVLHPVYLRILGVLRSESWAALATVLLTVIAILLVIVLLGAQVLGDAQRLSASLTSGAGKSALGTLAQNLGPSLETYLPGAQARLVEFSASLGEYVKIILTWLIQNLGVAFSGVSAFFIDLFIFFFALYYLLRDGVRLRARLVAISPLADRDDLKIFSRLELAVNSVVKGKLLIGLLQGILVGLGFALFGVPNAIFWGVLGAIASLLPPFGTGLVVFPAVGYLFLYGALGPAIGLALWGAVAVGLVDNVLAPKLMASGTALHPLLVLLSVLGGLALFGPIGIFLGPLSISLLIMLLTLHSDISQSGK